MTPEAIRSVVMSHIAASWTLSAIAYPNRDFNSPKDGSPWIRPLIKFGDTAIGELGDDGVGWRTGVLMNSIFTKADDGLKKAFVFADTWENLFRRRCLSGVIFDEPSTDAKGIESGWHHVLILVNFTTLIGE